MKWRRTHTGTVAGWKMGPMLAKLLSLSSNLCGDRPLSTLQTRATQCGNLRAKPTQESEVGKSRTQTSRDNTLYQCSIWGAIEPRECAAADARVRHHP